MSNSLAIPPIPPPAQLPPPDRFPSAPRRRIWPIILLACTVFLAGAGLGVGATFIFIARRAQYAIQHPEQAPTRLANVLKRRLDLTVAQTKDVEQILTKRQKRLQTLRNKLEPEMNKELEDMRAEIAAVLRRDQQAQWDATYDEMKTQWMPPPPQP